MSLAEVHSDFRPDPSSAVVEMHEPILVAGQYHVWWLWSAVVGTALLALAAAMVSPFRPSETRWLGLLAAGGAGVSGVLAAVQRARRTWITWDDVGFQLQTIDGVISHQDAEVVAIANWREWQHSFGTVVAERHLVRIWFLGRRRPGRLMSTRSPLGECSPLHSLIDRLRAQLVERAENALRRGESLKGDGWEWFDGSIRGSTRRTTVDVPLDEISAVGATLRLLSIWRNSDPVPAIQLPCRNRSVWLLANLLARRFGRPGDEEVVPASGLGRVLSDHRPRTAALFSFSLALAAMLVAGLCLAAAISLQMLPLALLGGGVGLTALALISTALGLWRSSFRHHERGISQTGLSGQRRLRFRDIDQFAFDARRQYSKGRYLGTQFTMAFVNNARPRDSILHTERAAFETEELIDLRDRVSEELASRMVKQWRETRSVAWTPELTLHAGSLRYDRRRILAWHAGAIEIPFDQIRDYDAKDGWFYVWGKENDRALLRVRTGSSNFFPGLLLFEQLVWAAERLPLAARA